MLDARHCTQLALRHARIPALRMAVSRLPRENARKSGVQLRGLVIQRQL